MKRIALVVVNFIIVLVVAFLVVFYVRVDNREATKANQQKFQDTTIILEEIASNYLEDNQNICDMWAAVIEKRHVTMEEAALYLGETDIADGASAQLLWVDTLTGIASVGKASDPTDYSLDYNKSGLSDVLDDVLGENEIAITKRYSDPLTGAYVVAFCNAVNLYEDEETVREAVLMYVVPTEQLENRWTFPTEYGDSADVALIDAEGNYVIKPSSMKNTDFFSYIYSYNRGTVDTDKLSEAMTDNANGAFKANNATGDECYFVYAHLQKNSGWVLVSVITDEMLSGGEIDWNIPLFIFVALLLILIIDIGFINRVRLRERDVNKRLGEANKAQAIQIEKIQEQSAVIEALSADYMNIFVIFPEKDQAEVVKLDGYVTDELSRTSKNAPYMRILSNYARDRVHPQDKENFLKQFGKDNLLEAFREKTSHDYSYRALIDGETHYFEGHFVRVISEKENLEVVAGFRNIDALVADQEAKQKILEDALDAAQHANRAKTTFLNSMSHDIRTPMNAIIGFTSLAATHIDDEKRVKEYLSKIQISSNHLLSLINDVLDMSRIESGKVKIEEREVHLPDVLHDLRTIVQSDIKAKNLDFFIDIMDVVDEDVICDKLRLNQVLLNILSNAMKFTAPGGQVSVKVLQKPETDSGYADYSFKIKDTGIGMSKEFIEHIFEPFEREQTATVSGIQGSGLGMAITKNIVDMMGGTIEVNSEVGVGSEFIVNLSFKKTDKKVLHEPIPELEGAAALVVDDDMDSCISVCKMLNEIGMRTEWTSSGKEAIVRTRYACEREDSFAVYVIDWLMPDMNGIETVRRIRRLIGEDKPIIVLTSYEWSEVEDEAREAGVTHFISKPIFMSELRDVLSKPYAVSEKKQVEDKKVVDFAGRRILLVEDNELNQEIAVEILLEEGFKVDVAGDGSEAVAIMKKAKPYQYDLILMDIQMPTMDGYTATKEIRKIEDPRIAGIPIVAMTANAFEQDKHLAEEAGMDGYIPKPINIEKLMQTLAELLNA